MTQKFELPDDPTLSISSNHKQKVIEQVTPLLKQIQVQTQPKSRRFFLVQLLSGTTFLLLMFFAGRRYLSNRVQREFFDQISLSQLAESADIQVIVHLNAINELELIRKWDGVIPNSA